MIMAGKRDGMNHDAFEPAEAGKPLNPEPLNVATFGS